MIELRASSLQELPLFEKMESADDTADYILPYTQARHRQEFEREDILYLSIYADAKLAGFFILALERDSDSVEFRRIVIDPTSRGIGQQAIRLMEDYCSDRLGRARIWLDVFDFNRRGLHVYQKLGYRQFDQCDHENGRLLLLEKSIAPDRR